MAATFWVALDPIERGIFQLSDPFSGVQAVLVHAAPVPGVVAPTIAFWFVG